MFSLFFYWAKFFSLGHFYVRFLVCVRVPCYFQANLNPFIFCSVFDSFSFVFYGFSCFIRCCHFAIFLISHPSLLALRYAFGDDRSNFLAHHLICEPSFACSFLALLFSVLLAQFRDCALRSCFFWRLPIFICNFFSGSISSAGSRVSVSGVTARAFVVSALPSFSCLLFRLGNDGADFVSSYATFRHCSEFLPSPTSPFVLFYSLFRSLALPHTQTYPTPTPHRRTAFIAYALPSAQRTTSSTSAGNMQCTMWATADEIVLLELKMPF